MASVAILLVATALVLGAGGILAAETFRFSGDSTTMSLAEGGQHALLTGHGRVESQDIRITADSIELFYDRDKKIARVRGNATLADLKNEMVVKGGFIEDRDKEQVDIIQIGVRIFHKDIVCRSEFARYQRDKKILELSGMPWVSKGDDVYQAARITVNLDTEDISLEGSVQGTLQDKGAASDNSGGAQPGASPAAPAQKTPEGTQETPSSSPSPSPSGAAGSPSPPAGGAAPASPSAPTTPSPPPSQGTNGGN